MKTTIILWIARLLAAVILLQTLFFKFTGAEESVYIFTTVGMEPWGRYFVGIMELVAAILILIPKTSWVGALTAAGLMVGAIGMHLTILGIEVKNDGGYLFILAFIVLVTSLLILYLERTRIGVFISEWRQGRLFHFQ
jgi:putative oxidoreductase